MLSSLLPSGIPKEQKFIEQLLMRKTRRLAEKTLMPTYKGRKLDSHLITYTKNQFKIYQGLKLWSKNITFLQENPERKLHHSGFCYDFIAKTTNAKAERIYIN